MARTKEASRAAIVAAAFRVLRKKGLAGTTVEAVAREARCAKGLVHYHFKTKTRLLAAVAEDLGATRREEWIAALSAADAKAAIQNSWALLSREARDGTLKAWSALAFSGELTGQTVKREAERFAAALSEALGSFLRTLDLDPTVPVSEMGGLLAAVVHGVGLELQAGGDSAHLEAIYAAAWLGLLALSRPAAV
ncbi:MAG: hypothetical protein KatS3mg081_2223 [Gemmatimonadales bacterium]|nr:HTH-type transcriptional regulator BetI [bacterium HR33]GIW52868.1 MAG: hypothetical protein KatS3mg081_2223 [Gemmatimonadales bacterium]